MHSSLRLTAVALIMAAAAAAAAEQDIAKLRDRAADGEVRAQTLLGIAYYRGDGVEADYGEALRWLEVASQAGDALATVFLGLRAREEGRPEEALPLLAAAAARGQPRALTELGDLLLRGEGTAADDARAREAFAAAAAQGEPEAMLRLAEMMLCCDGDGARAAGRRLMRRAAALGLAQARIRHAELLLAESGPDAVAEAVFFLRASAEAVNALAWRLATSPEPAQRDGARARRLMETLLSSAPAPDPRYLDTLAAAWAELGRYEDAAAAQQRAVTALPPETAPEVRAGFESRLALFRRGLPYRDGVSP